MFCRNCAQELSEKAFACIGCGLNPKDGTSYCPGCGTKTKETQIMCTACGVSLKRGNTDEWPAGIYIGFLFLSFIIPLFGWIYGGIQVKNSSSDSKRRNQAWHFIISASLGGLINLMMILAK